MTVRHAIYLTLVICASYINAQDDVYRVDIKNPSEDVELGIGEQLVVECLTNGPNTTPVSVSLRRNGERLYVTISPTFKQGEHMLTYFGSGDEEGEYECRLEDDMNVLSDFVKVTRKQPEDEFQVEMLLPRESPAEYKIGENFVVQCIATVPHLRPQTVMMTKDGEYLPVALSDTLDPGVYLLTYHGDGQESGEYSCDLYNDKNGAAYRVTRTIIRV